MLTASGKQRRRKIESDAEHSGHPAITDRAAALVRPGDVGERLNEYATVYAARRALRREQQQMDEAKSSTVHLHKPRQTRSAPTANRECALAVGADRAAGRSARTDQSDACATSAAGPTAATLTGHRSASPPAAAPPSASAPGSPASCTSYTSCAASLIAPARAVKNS